VWGVYIVLRLFCSVFAFSCCLFTEVCLLVALFVLFSLRFGCFLMDYIIVLWNCFNVSGFDYFAFG